MAAVRIQQQSLPTVRNLKPPLCKKLRHPLLGCPVASTHGPPQALDHRDSHIRVIGRRRILYSDAWPEHLLASLAVILKYLPLILTLVEHPTGS